jgi:hypothetical protein
MQKLRGKIGSIRPHDGVQFRIHTEELELFKVFQRLKHRADELGLQVDFPLRSVAKP